LGIFFSCFTTNIFAINMLGAGKLNATTLQITHLDTLPSTKKNYQGYRLQVTNIQVTKKKGHQRKLTCTLINTGREKIRLPLATENPIAVIIEYDHSLSNSNLANYKNDLERALYRKKLKLEVGNITSNFELKFNLTEKQLSENKSNQKTTDQKNNFLPTDTEVYDKSLCADLRIDTVFIIKRSKRTVELAFKITNYGKGPAALFGATPETEDNVAIRAYASGTPKLSRGDLVLGGAYIEDGLADKNGILLPNESFSGSFTVETKKKTRYMPYFILSVDDYQALWECDERNNVLPLLDRT
ncbi:MAG: hypothetical protein AAGJ18_04350, partial [Bacteroidota bacterium]